MTDRTIYIYTVEVRYRDGSRENVRINSSNDKNVFRRLFEQLENKPISSVLLHKPVPKAGRKREKNRAIQKALKEHHRKKREESIVKYDGLTRIE